MSKLDQPSVDAANAALKWCQIYTTFVSFADPVNKQQKGIYYSATCSFIDTGCARICITNQHVIKSYRTMRMEKPDLVFQVGSYPIDIDSLIISEDEGLDLATFVIPSDIWRMLEKEGKKYCHIDKWPPKIATLGETVFYLGFPGILRERLSRTEYNFYMAALCEVVDSVSERHFGIAIDRETWVQQFGIKDMSELTDFGGFSGAIVFRLPDKLISTLEPIGILYESGQSMELHLIRHIAYINKDGQIHQTMEIA